MPRSHKTRRPPEFPNHQSLVTSYHLWKFPIDDLRHHALHIPVAMNAVQREPGGKLFHLFKGRGGIDMDLTAYESIHLIERRFPVLIGRFMKSLLDVFRIDRRERHQDRRDAMLAALSLDLLQVREHIRCEDCSSRP